MSRRVQLLFLAALVGVLVCVGLVVLALTVVMISGGIDLSVGSVTALAMASLAVWISAGGMV